ncbi:MAG: alpha/beta hydrolase, partial [Chloroflexi bacterium]|nr:alpha/beta hydrolase [Chloroflexota bacterium]
WLNYLRTFPQVSENENGDPEFQSKIRENPENYAFSFDVDDVSGPFLGPSLIITGRQDSIVGYRDAWKILENYPRATFAVLDRAGHLLEETEDLVHTLINEWLDRVEEGLGLA